MMPGAAQQLRHVYLYRLDDLHKIGSSLAPESRLASIDPLQQGHLVHTFPSLNAYKVEVALHRRFADCRIRREWFRLSPDDVTLVSGVERADVPEDLPTLLYRSPATGQIRIEPDLVRKIAFISIARGVPMTDIVSPILRPHIERLYAEALRALGREADPQEDKS